MACWLLRVRYRCRLQQQDENTASDTKENFFMLLSLY
jgi:hypothetical protein